MHESLIYPFSNKIASPTKDSFNQEELQRCGHGNLFDNGSGVKLPIDKMLMFDRIVNISKKGGKYGNGIAVAELDITPDLWFFQYHFFEDPIMPGCLGLEAMWQLVGFYLGWLGLEGKGRSLGVSDVKFRGQVLPLAKKVIYQISIKRIFNGKLNIGIADATMAVDDLQIYTATNLKVGLFK